MFLLQRPQRQLILFQRCRSTDILTTHIYPEYLKSMYKDRLVQYVY